MHGQLRQSQPDRGGFGHDRTDPILRKQRHRLRLGIAVLKHLDRAGPGPLLGIVDLAEIEHVTLGHPTVGQTPVLHEAPVAVVLAVLLAMAATQKHNGIHLYAARSLRQ